jgi:hypothetical protein
VGSRGVEHENANLGAHYSDVCLSRKPGLTGCGENEGDKAVREYNNKRIAALSRKATVKYIREHPDLYTERFSEITCADIAFVGWTCGRFSPAGEAATRSR